MATPTAIAAYVALFALTGFLFLFVNLLVGWLVRPRLPNQEKLEVYECGEPTIGSSFVQFDLRFYVVALLFIIFDVEVAFFFPWATVFGKATQLAAENAPVMAADVDPSVPTDQLSPFAATQLRELGISEPAALTASAEASASLRETADRLALTSIADIGVFFGVLLVGFAYVWRRGDLDWVRAMTRQKIEPTHRPPPARALEPSQSILSA
ncbi:MAG: NADH-quinone oxidoreductase subunit A [Pirellulales bacterium]